MRMRLAAMLCLAALGCGKEPAVSTVTAPSVPVATPGAEDTGPWPRLKAIIVADHTPPETRPVDLEGTAVSN